MMWLILLIITNILPFTTFGVEPSQVCSTLELESTIQTCWDSIGASLKNQHIIETGTVCEVQQHSENHTTFVVCTTRGWSSTQNEVQNQEDRNIHSRQKRFFGLLFLAIGCFFFCHSRDSTPPLMDQVCGQDISRNADKLQVNTIVTWPENNAWDEVDGSVAARLVSGKSPGHHFWDTTNIAYMARDHSDNAASCAFNVIVKVIRCPQIPSVSDGYYICHPSDDMIYGAVCRFGCYAGHELIGGISEITCTQEGKWSNSFPRCQKITCPRLLPSTAHLRYHCSDENRFRSICTYSCPDGYDIKSGMSRVRVCTQFGTWKGIEPICIDIQPPIFTKCQSVVYGYTARNSLKGKIVWTYPTASDNHDKDINVKWNGTVSPNDLINVGTYTITYNAEDSTGNKAIPCITKVVMKAITCPNIFPTPFQTVTCPSGTRYGSICNFSCEAGTNLKGTDIVVCERENSNTFGDWTWGNNQPSCEVMQKCAKKLIPPGNGALACDKWYGGKLCQMLCKEGYDVSPGKDFEEMLVCGQSGEWLPKNALPLPDCSKSLSAKQGIYRMAVSYYFDGDCTNPATVEKIKDQFIETLKSSKYEEGCSVGEDKCNINNVEVRCSEKGRKRSAEMTIAFDIRHLIEHRSLDYLTSAQLQFFNILENSRKNGIFDNLLNETGSMRAQSIRQEKFALDCPLRTIASLHTFSCVECSPGTYYDNNKLSCPQCDKGYYQDTGGQDSCVRCPENTTTQFIGSKGINDCIDACKPGYWSTYGTPECSLCPIGSYSNNFGASKCTECPFSKSTDAEGANDESFCENFDLWLTEEQSKVYLALRTAHFIKKFIVSFWVQSHYLSLTLKSVRENTSMNYIVNKNASERESDMNNGWHFHVLSIYETNMEVYVDNEMKSRKKNDLQLKPNETYKVELHGKGKLSQLNVWSTMNTNQQDALPEIMKQKMTCSAQSFGDILPWKEFEDINFDSTFKHIPSECDDFDSCESNPCLNGVCQDKLEGFECSCFYGFYGITCEGNVDDCVDNACENNATCKDGAANYTCLCSDGFKGALCEIAMVDGGWGKWSEWSPCSVTCGNGTKRRHRFCNNPAPDNGGLDCPGSATDHTVCTMDECRVCSNITVTEHVLLSCENDSNNINCTISCEEGYDFDHSVKPFYVCGEITYQLWDFKTLDNPYGKLPQCTEKRNSEEMTFVYAASYIDLVCDSDDKVIDSHQRISQKIGIETNNIDCLKNATCALRKIQISNCQKRTKRNAEHKTAGFEIEITCDSHVYNSEECYRILLEALQLLLHKTESNELSTIIQGQMYHIQPSSAHVKTNVKCPPGTVASDIFCVECSYGRYNKDGQCVKCDFGTYQDEIGQSTCKVCPKGTTTPGRDSRSVNECSVHLNENSNGLLYTVVGALSVVLLGGLLSITILVFKHRSKRMKQTDMQLFEINSEKYGMGKPLNYTIRHQQKFLKKGN